MNFSRTTRVHKIKEMSQESNHFFLSVGRIISIIKNALNSVFYCYVLVGQSYFPAQQYANIVLIIKYL